MRSEASQRAASAQDRRRCERPRGAAALIASLFALTLAACATDGQPGTTAATPRGPTVAFESIDGPPAGVFHALVQDLSEEADARAVAVVSRDAPAQYRVRSYVAARVERGQVTVAWVWDVYDADRRRSLRISGEVPAGTAGRDAWTAAGDQVLRRIARTGMDRLVAFLAAPAREPAPPPPAEPGDRIAAPGAPAGRETADAPAPKGRPAAAAGSRGWQAFADARPR